MTDHHTAILEGRETYAEARRALDEEERQLRADAEARSEFMRTTGTKAARWVLLKSILYFVSAALLIGALAAWVLFEAAPMVGAGGSHVTPGLSGVTPP